jgi:hypothetical protein
MPCKCLETKDVSNCCPPFEIGNISCKRHILNIAFAFSTNLEYQNFTNYGKFNKMLKHFTLSRTVNYFATLVKHLDFVSPKQMERIYQTDACSVDEFNFCKLPNRVMVRELKKYIEWYSGDENNIKKFNTQLEELIIKNNPQELLDLYRIIKVQ